MATKAQKPEIALAAIDRQIADLQSAKKKTLEYFQSDEYIEQKERDAEYDKLLAFISKDMEFKKLKRISDKLDDGSAKMKITFDVKVFICRDRENGGAQLDISSELTAYTPEELINESPEFIKLGRKLDAEYKKHEKAVRSLIKKLVTKFKPKFIKVDAKLIDDIAHSSLYF